MKELQRFRGILLSIVCAVPVFAQTAQTNRVSSVFAVLTKMVDSKNAITNDEIILTAITDVSAGGVVIPRGSKIVGHITQISANAKDGRQIAMSVVMDKAVRPDGTTLSLQAIIAAVAAPKDTALSSDPIYGMMRSNEPTMTGVGAGNAARSGDLAAGSKSQSTAAVATANLKGIMDSPLLLTEESAGVIGYEGLSLTWGLAAPPPFTVFVSKSKSIKLYAGTQVLLRMAPPRLPK